MNKKRFLAQRTVRITISVMLPLITLMFVVACNPKPVEKTGENDVIYVDVPFLQETHEAFYVTSNDNDNEIRSIALDANFNVWIATASGVFRKDKDTRNWTPVIEGESRGPAYSVAINPNGDILLGTWNGLYRFSDGKLTKAEGVKPPVSVICNDGDENYALGPYGIWHSKNKIWETQPYQIARSVRDAISDEDGNLWVATDAGLYRCKDDETELIQNTNELISCYVKAIAEGPGNQLWAGVMGGVSIRENNQLVKNLTPRDGVPTIFVNCIEQSPEGVMWVGTDVGVVRFYPDGSHSLRFSKRWLTNDKVNDIAFDKDGNAWVATANGVSLIKKNNMTLADKEKNFYSQMMWKHMREPWICGPLHLEVPGDTSTWRHTDDDNDGEYTGGYLAMESFRYAATKDPDAKMKARKAFDFLVKLQTITGTEGFFARTIVPVDWQHVHDPNRTYTERQVADELVNDPRYKPVEIRWHKSADGKWLWKGDTSSDEMDGHMMSYFYFYELAADDQEKQLVRDHVSKIVDYLMKHNYNFVDVDGEHTRWAVWSPEQLNGDPDWSSEKSLNSFELLAYLKFAAHITGNEKYEKEYRRLIDEEAYLENASHLNHKNPAWQIYFDLTMEGYLFPMLIKYETDLELKSFYQDLMDEWMAKQTAGENLYNNLAYTFVTGKKVNIQQTLDFLKDAPLDLMDWPIDHTLREDVSLIRSPILEEVQITELPPASIRATVRWDKNPWAATQGDPSQVREPIFWLWPYWEARYLGIIENK
ncbi:MAG: two-component regulator propeller domain-containing protein [Draconibacterium sp.]